VKARRTRKRLPRSAGAAALTKRLRETQRQLRVVRERHAIAMGAINEGLYDWDIAHNRVYFWGGMERLLGLSSGVLKTSFKDWHELIHPGDFARYRDATIAHLKGKTERFECDYRYRAFDGTWRWARTHGLAQRDATGRAVRMVGSTGDITELKERERQLAEALAEQTATAEQQKAANEVLHVISSSIADTGPVFDKILESCQRLFAGRIVGLNLVREDGMLHIGAYHGAQRQEFERIFPIPVTRESGSGLSIVERRVVHYPDAQNGPEVPARTRQGCTTIGIRSAIFAPLLWEGRGVGAIFVGRDHVSSFSEKEIGLLRTFADQAAIAIENVRLFREIQEKSRQLEVASRHKSEFLANMSHELRTPLNAIIGFTRIVMRRSREGLEPKQYENLEKILASGEHLLALINSVLDLSKIEAGRLEVHAGEVALAPVLERCLRTVEPLARVPLVREFDGELPRMYVDEEKLRQIVINLLSNAAKFTERGDIRLKAQAAHESVAIAVADTGIGIPPDKLQLIFEEFEQADASSTRSHAGTGLGLAIARRLARLMGGDVTAESMLGAGSTFRLTLPLHYTRQP
jgi:PAS domain S-box-containing protein